MAVRKYGLLQPVREPGSRLSKTLGGAEVFEESRVGWTDDIERLYFGLALDIMGPLGLLLEHSEVLYDEGDMAHLRLRWAGIRQQTLPLPLWRVVRTPREESIETHPLFISDLGGTPEDPKNNAEFDESGNFVGFPIETENPMSGVERYLEQMTVVSVDRLAFQEPDAGERIPRLNTPTIGGSRGIRRLPSLAQGQQWFKWDLSYTKRGNVFEIHEEWVASGNRGVNELVYPA